MTCDVIHEYESSNISLCFTLGSASRLSGGLFTSVRKLAHRLHDQSIDVDVVAIRDVRTDMDLKEWAPLTPTILDGIGPSNLGIGRGFTKAILANNYDILHQHGIWKNFSSSAVKFKRTKQAPVVISPRGMLDSWALANSRLKKRIAGTLYENTNLKAADCIHALNRSEMESVRRFGLSNPVATIPNGTDLPVLNAPVSRSKLVPNDGRKYLLFLGRIHPKKGLSELIKAWGLIASSQPSIVKEWRLVIAGWDEIGLQDDLQHQSQSFGFGPTDIIFTGPVFGEEKESILKYADAFILPSHSEGLPIAVLEAWSWALPVFMTEACNIPEGFSSAAAIKVSTDADMLAQKLIQGLQFEDLQSIGAAGRMLAENQFSWGAIGGKFEELYRWLHAGSPKGEIPAFVEC